MLLVYDEIQQLAANRTTYELLSTWSAAPFAHSIAEPKWEIRGQFLREYCIELERTPLSIDFAKLNGKPFDFAHIGGHRNWFRVRDAILSVLRAA